MVDRTDVILEIADMEHKVMERYATLRNERRPYQYMKYRLGNTRRE